MGKNLEKPILIALVFTLLVNAGAPFTDSQGRVAVRSADTETAGNVTDDERSNPREDRRNNREPERPSKTGRTENLDDVPSEDLKHLLKQFAKVCRAALIMRLTIAVVFGQPLAGIKFRPVEVRRGIGQAALAGHKR